jgi:NADH dehydrogenase [ubiquinone] 1 alpha subcomplex assembly factor 6
MAMRQGWVSDTGDLGGTVRRVDRDRFLCAQFAPPGRRPAILTLYAFNQEVARIAESVSEPLLGHMRLRWWHDAIDAAFQGQSPPRHPVASALAEVIREFQLDRRPFDTLLTARAVDLEDTPPANSEALVAYARDTSASLNEITLSILGATADGSRDAAREVGIAWALIGLLRSLPHQARRRRLYLPADLCHRAGISPEAVFAGKAGPGLAEVVSSVAATATRHLEMAATFRRDVDRSALPVVLPAVLARGYLRRLARADYDPFSASDRNAGPMQVGGLMWAAFRGRY